MRASKTEAAVNYEKMISLHEVLQLLRELECLGFVKRTGEFQHGYPVYAATATSKEACSRAAQPIPTFNRGAQRDDLGGGGERSE
ncbi:MAG: hypothetical protein L0H94_02505 [Nitrospira sp.]|nr:hypothetical protein [Nitrospira sp.]